MNYYEELNARCMQAFLDGIMAFERNGCSFEELAGKMQVFLSSDEQDKNLSLVLPQEAIDELL